MDKEKLHIGTIYATVVFLISCAPALYWFSSQLVYAEDFEKSRVQINIQVQQNYIDMKKEINNLHLNRFTDMIESGKDLRPDQDLRFKELQQERHVYIRKELELDKLRQENY